VNLIDVYGFAVEPAQNADLKKQLAAAIATAAVQILSESKDTANYDDRHTWAKRAIATPAGPGLMADQMIWGFLGNATVQADLGADPPAVDDGAVQFVVNTLINVYAP
jgi:hypothetical protein